MKIDLDNLEAFARGAAFLGTGGGGDPYVGRMLAKHAIQEHAAPTVIEADELDDEAWVFTIAMLGAPTVLTEKAACGDDVDLALALLEKDIGCRPAAILPIEIGGVNSCLPVMAAARANLPLVNADGMGRAFPELQMVTFNVYGVSATPVAVVDEHLNSSVIKTSSAKSAEDYVRSFAIQAGLSVIVSCYPMQAKDLKAYGVHDTLRMALGIGEAIERGRQTGDAVEQLISYLRSTRYYNQATVLFDGKITDLLRETTRGFALGKCMIADLNNPDRVMQVKFQNENLIAEVDGRAVAMVPDLICIVDRETAEPIPTEALRYGQRVKVIGASVAAIMRTPESLAVFGPRCFGLDCDFVPIEQLNDIPSG